MGAMDERSAYLAQALQEMGGQAPAPMQQPDLAMLARMAQRVGPGSSVRPGEMQARPTLGQNLMQAGQNVLNAPQRFQQGLQRSGQNLKGLFGMGKAQMEQVPY